MGKSLRNNWIAWCVAQASLAGCSGDQLHLGGSNVQTRCEPGAYLGTYDCTGADASPFPPMSGAIFFDLQGERGGATLAIAPGAKLTGTQSIPGLADFSFVADMSGTVDCTTYKLVGQVSNITFNSSLMMIVVKMNGDLTADYDSTALPPALVNGALSSPASLGASGFGPAVAPSTNYCSWMAALHP
jgi:hypothetical protein